MYARILKTAVLIDYRFSEKFSDGPGWKSDIKLRNAN